MIFFVLAIIILMFTDSYNGNRIYRDWQRVGIQLSYKFNATKSKYKGTGAGQSEKSRL